MFWVEGISFSSVVDFLPDQYQLFFFRIGSFGAYAFTAFYSRGRHNLSTGYKKGTTVYTNVDADVMYFGLPCEIALPEFPLLSLFPQRWDNYEHVQKISMSYTERLQLWSTYSQPQSLP